jgi:hypothetical protein
MTTSNGKVINVLVVSNGRATGDRAASNGTATGDRAGSNGRVTEGRVGIKAGVIDVHAASKFLVTGVRIGVSTGAIDAGVTGIDARVSGTQGAFAITDDSFRSTVAGRLINERPETAPLKSLRLPSLLKAEINDRSAPGGVVGGHRTVSSRR